MMKFSEIYKQDITKLPLWESFYAVLEPVADSEIEKRAAKASHLTRQFFGRTMRLFAPLYLSNECINSCAYCGFSRENPILRTTLTVEKTKEEARFLFEQGFRSVLLVAGEHPKFVSQGYLKECIEALIPFIPSVSIEVGPEETAAYVPLVEAGCEGLVLYQETYHREIYKELHRAGPKKDFDRRLDGPSRGAEAGFRRVGVGALLGLAPWREDVAALAVHLDYLLRVHWKTHFTVSLPRMRPAAGDFSVLYPVSDRELIQAMIALRTFFPQVGIVLSTRESGAFRNAVASIGVTTMSAGSHTEPGGYTGIEQEDIHRTEKGISVPLASTEKGEKCASKQFDIADERSAGEISQMLSGMGLEPVWKDWEASLGVEAS